MKAVMLAIRPRHSENICTVIGEENGEPVYKKTIEVRKKAPKCDTPFKCYIYATVGAYRDVYRSIPKEPLFLIHRENEKPTVAQSIAAESMRTSTWELCNGKVIGEFVCDKVDTYNYHKGLSKFGGSLGLPISAYDSYLIFEDDYKAMCLTYDEVKDYGKGKPLYGLHITDLKIYDTPKELGEFRHVCPVNSSHGQSVCRNANTLIGMNATTALIVNAVLPVRRNRGAL